jgi:tRNA-specific 2-thiouridylase
MRLIAAMSGGVDSAVAAARALDAGHEVRGAYLRLTRQESGCSSARDAEDARQVANRLGIPFIVLDLPDRFEQVVIANFTAEYSLGRTPNPCLICNEKIKFATLLDYALDLGFDAMITGHYARPLTGEDGLTHLRRGVDENKDQSYVLARLDQSQLSRIMLPLGDSHKPQVRLEAAERGFAVADKPDSTDICFIPDGDTAGFLDRSLGRHLGEIVDESGAVVGAHTGHHHYTIGQRKGLNIRTPSADGQPRYVTGIDAQTNRVRVGSRAGLQIGGLRGTDLKWSTTPRTEPWCGQVQLRAHGIPISARFSYPSPGVLQVDFDTPAVIVAPGQTAVCYAEDEVIGSAVINSTLPVSTAQQMLSQVG